MSGYRGRRRVQRLAACGARRSRWEWEPLSPTGVLGGREASLQREKLGEEGMERKPREWGGGERGSVIEQERGRGAQTKQWLNPSMPGVGVLPLPLQASERGAPQTSWSLAHPFSELLCQWREVRGRYECFCKGSRLSVFGSRAHQRGVGGKLVGLRPGHQPWQSRGGAVCKMASAKQEKEGCTNKGADPPSEGAARQSPQSCWARVQGEGDAVESTGLCAVRRKEDGDASLVLTLSAPSRRAGAVRGWETGKQESLGFGYPH